jgi:hypothetical protein
VKQAAAAVEALLDQTHRTLQSQVTELDEIRERNANAMGTIWAQSDPPQEEHRKVSGAK